MQFSSGWDMCRACIPSHALIYECKLFYRVALLEFYPCGFCENTGLSLNKQLHLVHIWYMLLSSRVDMAWTMPCWWLYVVYLNLFLYGLLSIHTLCSQYIVNITLCYLIGCITFEWIGIYFILMASIGFYTIYIPIRHGYELCLFVVLKEKNGWIVSLVASIFELYWWSNKDTWPQNAATKCIETR